MIMDYSEAISKYTRGRPLFVQRKKSTAFYDKETALCLMADYYDASPIKYIYEFNNVEYSIFIEPDITLYDIQKVN